MAWFFPRKPKHSDELYALYNAIVAQSRQSVFYAEWGVPDTLTGRFDMISLHMCLVLRRLREGGGETRDFAQDLFDLFFKDMDRNLREIGVTDIGVPKNIEKLGELFYGLLQAVTAALADSDPAALEEVLRRNVLVEGEAARPAELAAYVRGQADRLAAIGLADIMAGHLFAGEAA